MYAKKKSRCGGGSSRVLWRQDQYSFQTAKLQAKGKWKSILTNAGISEDFLTGKHRPCPACGGKDRFRFDNKELSGSYLCSGCGSGDGFSLIQKCLRLTPLESLKRVRLILTGVSEASPLVEIEVTDNPEPDLKHVARLNRFWFDARPIQPGDPVHGYLIKTRGLTSIPSPHVVRYHPSMAYYEDREFVGNFPAMLALVSSPNGKAIALHRTYLSQAGQKADVAQAKKLTRPTIAGGIAGGAIRLIEPGKQLGLCEGLETALACTHLFGVPTWSLVSAPLMPCVKLPDSVREVFIFADNDTNRVGQIAAYKLAERLIKEGRTVRVYIPPTPDTDWLDFVQQGGSL